MTNHLLVALGGVAASLVLYFLGFRTLSKYRLLANIPRSPIRSIAMGLVQIHGKAKSEQTVPAPLTGSKCLFYKVAVAIKLRNQKSQRRTFRLQEADGVPFNCEDKTGRVLVDAHGADFDLIPTLTKEVVLRSRFTSVGYGRKQFSSDPTMTLPSKGVSDYSVQTYVDDLILRKRDSVVGDGIMGKLAQGAINLELDSAADCRYRVTEYCILPEHWYDVVGTCTINPQPKDASDGNMIAKGTNDPIFNISWRSEKVMEQRLRNKALLQIGAGAVCTMVAAAFLLHVLGML